MENWCKQKSDPDAAARIHERCNLLILPEGQPASTQDICLALLICRSNVTLISFHRWSDITLNYFKRFHLWFGTLGAGVLYQTELFVIRLVFCWCTYIEYVNIYWGHAINNFFFVCLLHKQEQVLKNGQSIFANDFQNFSWTILVFLVVVVLFLEIQYILHICNVSEFFLLWHHYGNTTDALILEIVSDTKFVVKYLLNIETPKLTN